VNGNGTKVKSLVLLDLSGFDSLILCQDQDFLLLIA